MLNMTSRDSSLIRRSLADELPRLLDRFHIAHSNHYAAAGLLTSRLRR
jgi:hypothetical protein